MKNITIGRYSNPENVGWLGWLEPDDRSWIVFVALDGTPTFYGKRDPDSGAVLE